MAFLTLRPRASLTLIVCLTLAVVNSPVTGKAVSNKRGDQIQELRAKHQNHSADTPQPPASSADGDLTPARFIRIYEDMQGDSNRREMYDPARSQSQKTTQLSADEKSTIVVFPDGNLMGTEPALNKLYISAVLASGNHTKAVSVAGYSEVGEPKATSEAQRGMAFESAANLQNMLLNMSYTAQDIVTYFYCGPGNEAKADGCPSETRELELRSQGAQQRDQELENEVKNAQTDGRLIKRLEERFRLYQPEIASISTFFASAENLNLVEIMGTEVFWVDRTSLQAIAAQYKADMRIAFDNTSTPSARNEALQDMLERTKLVYTDFGDARREIRENIARWRLGPGPTEAEKKEEPALEKTLDLIKNRPAQQGETKAEGSAREEDLEKLVKSYAIDAYARKTRGAAVKKLVSLFAPGFVSLQSAGAKDGDMLTVTVEIRGGEGNNPGIKSVFEIAIKRYGAKILWGPSFIFVQRRRVPAGAPGLNRVNFAPSPGMTYGVTFLKRGDSSFDKFVRGLGPGIAVNVSFLNFNDPGFDLTTQKFTNTTGVNVQVGSGIVGSLFDNKLQFTYGWNLNVDRKRQYWGVGFGFVEIATALTKYLK